MKALNERQKPEKERIRFQAIALPGKDREASEEAYLAGQEVAKRWIKSASNQEIKDALRRPNSHHDINYFAFMRNIYFSAIEKRFPKESNKFKWFYNVSFMDGWRDKVILIWESINVE